MNPRSQRRDLGHPAWSFLLILAFANEFGQPEPGPICLDELVVLLASRHHSEHYYLVLHVAHQEVDICLLVAGKEVSHYMIEDGKTDRNVCYILISKLKRTINKAVDVPDSLSIDVAFCDLDFGNFV